MKFFIVASMLFGGGSAVALNNEEVQTRIEDNFPKLVNRRVKEIRHERNENRVAYVMENGIPYPDEEKLVNLTEDQQIAIFSLIDQYNAEYDFLNMTEDEVIEVLQLFREDMKVLAEELGLELPEKDPQALRKRVAENMKEHMEERFQNILNDIRENGFTLKEDTRLELTEEQQLAIETKVEEINATYDFSTMTDEELKDALTEIKDDLHDFFAELEIQLPEINKDQARRHIKDRFNK